MAEIVGKSPDPVAAIKALGSSIARSQMMGPTDRAEIGEVIVMLCLTQGWTLAEVFRTYQLSFGKLEKKIDAAMAEFKSRGGKVEWLADGSNLLQARARFTLGDESIEAFCTVEEAKKAGWTKNTKWTTEPQTMLKARVKKRGILALCPDIFFGEYDQDERPQADVALDASRMAEAAAKAATAPAATKPAPAATQTAPAATQTAPAATQTAPAATPPPAGPRLSDEMQTQLIGVIGADNVPLCTEWARSVNWLAAEATLEELPVQHADDREA